MPTEAEIAAECERIRAGLSDEELNGRYVGPGRIPWRVPGVDRHSKIVDREAMPKIR